MISHNAQQFKNGKNFFGTYRKTFLLTIYAKHTQRKNGILYCSMLKKKIICDKIKKRVIKREFAYVAAA